MSRIRARIDQMQVAYRFTNAQRLRSGTAQRALPIIHKPRIAFRFSYTIPFHNYIHSAWTIFYSNGFISVARLSARILLRYESAYLFTFARNPCFALG